MTESRSDRSLRARAAAYERWAKTEDRTSATEPARAGLDARFAAEVDPDGKLDPAERARRVTAKRKAHFARLALLSAQSRRKLQSARTAGAEERARTEASRTAAELRQAADDIDAATRLAP